ncbi:Acetyl-hydrolase [Trichophyton interdigitale]|uniref:Acetyl-hydrolase n=1 Tax=Trichophyton interdigitale TaxID=101480 RepID=A0A9P4YIP6_9EURO|nr:Acetyl-hydrolase [Trichophyton interdigitale]KAF3900537.1 Acetyl-hydrolase [Trichophyton interdigitale]KAG8210289.1 Acetyl-hydrolase [Trichophyton interdigitale]
MASLNLTLIQQYLVRIPLVLVTAIRRLLQLSPVQDRVSVQMELLVTFVRSFLTLEDSVSKMAEVRLTDSSIKGYMWISNVTVPKPEDDVLEALVKAIRHRGEGGETFDMPDVRAVEAEWTGYRKGASEDTPIPDISDADKYERLMEDVDDDMTIFYAHGGAYHMMDPCTHRSTTTALARLSRSRCFSIRYRLCPQHPFPAGLLDALVAYLSLLSPAEGALYEAVPAKEIVFVGDSAGGGLCLGLLQALLTLREIIPFKTIRFHGKDVPLDLPAGIATTSPWCDITRSLPSTFENAKYDYVPPPPQKPGTIFTPLPFPPDHLWPTVPPRVDLYANANMMAHPFTSPAISPKGIWKGSPPMYIAVGEELLHDDGVYMARKAHRDGVNVVFERYEGMPHCFALLAPNVPQSQRCLKGWAKFCVDAVHDRVKGYGKAQFLNHSLTKTDIRSLDDIGTLTDDEVEKLIKAGRDWRIDGEHVLQKAWKEQELDS